MPGPAKTPSALNELRGNPGKRPRNKSEPKHPAGEPTMPKWLTTDAAAVWRDVVPLLAKVPGLLARTHAESLGCYCDSIACLKRALAALKDGEIVQTMYGPKAHPAVKMRNDAMARILRFGQEFGITPAAATRVKTNDSGSGQPESLEEALQKATLRLSAG